MKAMILAAGFGKRMLPITNTTPKPLVKVGEYSLIEYHLIKLKDAGIKEVIINLYHLAEKIKTKIGDGSKYGLSITYSHEEIILDTGGGVYNVLDFFDKKPFLLISADIYTNFDYSKFIKQKLNSLAHIVLVKNPSFNDVGDFSLNDREVYLNKDLQDYTYANISIIKPELFNSVLLKNIHLPKFGLGILLKEAVKLEQVSGEVYTGLWENVGDKTILDNLIKKVSLLA